MQIDDVLAYFDAWNRPLSERSEHVQSIQFDDLGAFGRYGGLDSGLRGNRFLLRDFYCALRAPVDQAA